MHYTNLGSDLLCEFGSWVWNGAVVCKHDKLQRRRAVFDCDGVRQPFLDNALTGELEAARGRLLKSSRGCWICTWKNVNNFVILVNKWAGFELTSPEGRPPAGVLASHPRNPRPARTSFFYSKEQMLRNLGCSGVGGGCVHSMAHLLVSFLKKNIHLFLETK